MKIFDLDSPLMNVLNKMADLMWLNILTLICCIPIITAGAAFTSMHYVALKIVRNEESYITRSFFKSFKTNFRQATLIWLLILLIAAVLGGDYYIITKSGIQFSSVLVILIMAAAVLVICTALYVFPVLAKFDNTIMGTIRNAFIMSILQLPKTVVMFVMAFFPLIIYLVSLRLIPIIFLFGFSLPAYASAMLYNKFFRKLEDQLLSEQEPAPEVSPEEDELIETLVRLSGLTKQEYIVRRLQEKEIVVVGNPRVYKALRNQMAEIYEELKHLEKCSEENEELLSTLRLVAKTLYGLKGENE